MGIGSFFDPLNIGYGSAADDLINDFTGVTSAENANRANSANADKQMAFQERMSNTAYQRSMQDMQTAGLNPVLSAKNGGATTPNGAAATAQAVPSALGTLANKALETYTGLSSAKQSLASAEASESQSALNEAKIGETVAQTANLGQTGKQIAQQTKNLGAEFKKKETEGNLSKTVDDALNWVKSTSQGKTSARSGDIIDKAFDWWNKPKDERRAPRKSIMENYSGHPLKDWLKNR